MKFSAYIFDFDGTLVDSMPDWSAKMINVLEKNNISYHDDIIKIITPLGDLGTAKYFRDVLGAKISVDDMLMQMDEYALPKYRDSIELKAGVMDYLLYLKNNNCSLNVLTASPHKMLDVCLKRNGIYDLFDNVWSCDDFATTKADPQIYVEVAKKIGVDVADAVFFDDNINAIKTAAKAGMHTVGVYDDSGVDFKEELKSVADWYVDSFEGINPSFE